MSDYIIHTKHPGSANFTVMLFCFDTREYASTLMTRFEWLLLNPSWIEILEEPYLLFAIIYEDGFVTVDAFAWYVADRFWQKERKVLQRAHDQEENEKSRRNTTDSTDPDCGHEMHRPITIWYGVAVPPAVDEAPYIDFADLSRKKRECTYLVESVGGVIHTLEYMIAHLDRTNNSVLSQDAKNRLICRKADFESLRLRLRTLEGRVANSIDLAFNIIPQEDSRTMKAVALLTFIFLPATAVSTVFGMPFFVVDLANNDKKEKLRVATSLWIFAVAVVILTCFTLLSGYWVYKNIIPRRKSSKTIWSPFSRAAPKQQNG
jgi:Mg2+ and Co2+ transporter CorA